MNPCRCSRLRARLLCTPSHNWGGCFWRIEVRKRFQASLGIFVQPALDPKFDQNADTGKPKLMAFAVRVSKVVNPVVHEHGVLFPF